MKKVAQRLVFDVSPEGPATHYPAVNSRAPVIDFADDSGNSTERAELVFVGNNREKGIGVPERHSPLRLTVAPSVEIKLVGLVHQFESPGLVNVSPIIDVDLASDGG